MKSIRLLPVVIFAALALLIFKGIGLVTNGGYVLVGTEQVQAAGGGSGAESAGTMEAVMTDTSPTLDDTSPTLPTGPAKAEHAAAETDHGSSAASSEASTVPSGDASSSTEMPTPSAQPSSAAASEVACLPSAVSSEAGGHDSLPENIDAAFADCPEEAVAVNEHGDAVPTIQDGAGNIVPLATAEGDTSEQALLSRLSERRVALDTREADLNMRASLIEAAEKQLAERTQQLAALEVQVAALVDEKQAADDAGFRAIVSMYETMKPKEAAKIFDKLELPVMLKVARAMSARKMAPILAAMSAGPAQALTTAMASVDKAPPVAVASGENLAALPQIVGQ
ncbi:MAG: hypothetical protein EOP22_06715 [Hyphomicrobiales bacterium]|nr:MAG: hypothetical protein EOP22_06715 [Hyphomicrobiales bacterium]